MLLTGLLLVCSAPRAQQTSGSLADALGRDSELTLHFRTYYFDRLNPSPPDNAAWAIGGWAGYRTGWIGDVLRFGVVGYTAQPLWAPLDKPGSLLLTAQQDGYSVIGEAYGSLKLWDQVLTGGRFQVNQPEINAQDNRMTPITYSGGNLAGALATLTFQQTGTRSDYQTPYSGWAGYTYMIVKSFNLAGQKAWLLGGNYDFAVHDLPGLALNAAIVWGYDAIKASTGAAQPNWTEYDLTLDYRFSATRWPEWARPFWIRGRAAYVDMRADGNIQDYRLIVNRDWIF